VKKLLQTQYQRSPF